MSILVEDRLSAPGLRFRSTSRSEMTPTTSPASSTSRWWHPYMDIRSRMAPSGASISTVRDSTVIHSATVALVLNALRPFAGTGMLRAFHQRPCDRQVRGPREALLSRDQGGDLACLL